MNPNLENKIMKLIYSKKEDSYYDFKETRIKKDKLLKAIISLANCKHDGDRYLIFGVDDNFQVIGLEKGYTQSDLHDFLDKKLFAGENVPNIELETIFSKNKRIDVIIIKNEPHKPYYLIEKQNGEEQTNLTNIIWTRHKDKNSIAYYDEVKEMWKEQLGWTKSEEETFKNFLKDSENWKYNEEDSLFYYNLNSDYQVVLDNLELLNGQEPFSLFYLGGDISKKDAHFKVRNTTISSCKYVYCDGGCIGFPIPEIGLADPNDLSNMFYYYLTDSLEGAFAYMLFKKNGFESRFKKFPCIFFDNEEKQNDFSKFLQNFEEEIRVPKNFYSSTCLDPYDKDVMDVKLDNIRKNQYIYEHYY